jgi:uncharacterized membrane protein YeaQ/YmgE (transglycosylase-associated protein family)
MLSMPIAWVLIGLVAASIGSRLVDPTGASLLRDLILGAVGAVCGGMVLKSFEISTEDSLRPLELIAPLLGATATFAGWRLFALRRRAP